MPNLWGKFSSVASERPNATALLLGQDAVSFGELSFLTERFATRLHDSGARRDHVIALQLPKSKEAYALLLACLRQGTPYVFIDPKNPTERTANILRRLEPRLFFSATETKNPHGDIVQANTPDWAERWLSETDGGELVRPEAVSGTHPAYIMFTSGSTGEPKGAVIPHQGVLSLMRWARHLIPDICEQRFTAINPLHFDNSVFDIYCGLLNGATLVPIETGEVANPAAWTKAIRHAEASVMFAVPTLFLILDSLGLLTSQALPTVRLFMFGGEGFPIERLKDFHDRFAGCARLINVYGPTETSCICSSHEIDAEALDLSDSKFPALGHMHEDFEHLILDDAQNPMPRGTPGDLWIGGPCVGMGYYRNSEETRDRFRQHPLQEAYRSLWYRTGDLVMEDEDGLLWFRGRVDNQVKVRGHRIELEEIDLVVQSVPGVSRAISVVVDCAEANELHVAYVADRPISNDEIGQRCKEKLPSYMRPHRLRQCEGLPMNANGKVDRRAVKALLESTGSGE